MAPLRIELRTHGFSEQSVLVVCNELRRPNAIRIGPHFGPPGSASFTCWLMDIPRLRLW